MKCRAAIPALALCLLLSTASSALADPVSLTYFSELPEEVKDQIEDRLPDDVKPESALHARRQARRARTLIQSVLNSYGYYNPKIEMQIEVEEGEPRAGLNIDAGQQFTLRRMVLRYDGDAPRNVDQEDVEQSITLQPGMAAEAARVIDVERQVVQTLRAAGYPYAEVSERDVIGDKEAGTISVRYTVNSGPRVFIGKALYPDDIRTRPSYLDYINPIEPDTLYDPADVALYNSRLSETRLFDKSVAKLADEPSGVTEDGDEVRNLVVDLRETDRHTLTLGAGFDTVEGFGITAELLRRNLTRRGDMLESDLTLSEREIGLQVQWRRPNVIGYGRGLILSAGLVDENTDAFDQQRARVGAALEFIESERLQYGVGTDLRYIRQTGDTVRRDFQVASINGGIFIDESDSVLDPRRGWRAEARLKPTYSISPDGPDVPYIRAVGQARAYLPLDENRRFVAAGRLRLGTLIGARAINVPGDDRFFSGGGGSVRGYGFQAIGPFDADDTPLGGRSLSEVSLEGRARVTDKIGAVMFIDAGNVSDASYPRFDNFRAGVGVGVRYQTPAGPIRLDVATPLNPTDRDDAVHIYISIGQAF